MKIQQTSENLLNHIDYLFSPDMKSLYVLFLNSTTVSVTIYHLRYK